MVLSLSRLDTTQRQRRAGTQCSSDLDTSRFILTSSEHSSNRVPTVSIKGVMSAPIRLTLLESYLISFSSPQSMAKVIRESPDADSSSSSISSSIACRFSALVTSPAAASSASADERSGLSLQVGPSPTCNQPCQR